MSRILKINIVLVCNTGAQNALEVGRLHTSQTWYFISVNETLMRINEKLWVSSHL